MVLAIILPAGIIFQSWFRKCTQLPPSLCGSSLMRELLIWNILPKDLVVVPEGLHRQLHLQFIQNLMDQDCLVYLSKNFFWHHLLHEHQSVPHENYCVHWSWTHPLKYSTSSPINQFDRGIQGMSPVMKCLTFIRNHLPHLLLGKCHRHHHLFLQSPIIHPPRHQEHLLLLPQQPGHTLPKVYYLFLHLHHLLCGLKLHLIRATPRLIWFYWDYSFVFQ